MYKAQRLIKLIMLVKVGTSFTPWLVHLFLGFGMEANVKQPQIVRELMQEKLHMLLKQYEL